MDDDNELKKTIVNRNKRIFCRILNRFQLLQEQGIISSEEVEKFKIHYNDMVIEDSKAEYLKIKSQEEIRC